MRIGSKAVFVFAATTVTRTTVLVERRNRMPYNRRCFASIQRVSVLGVCVGFSCIAGQPLNVENSRMAIDKDAKAAVSKIKVCNTSPYPVKLDLRLSPFTTESGVRSGTLTVAESEKISATGGVLESKKCVILQIALTDLAQVAAASAQLSNGNDVIATLILIRDHGPYGLSVDGMPADKPEVHLFRRDPDGRTQQEHQRIFVKNADPWPYVVRLNIDFETSDGKHGDKHTDKQVDPQSCETFPPKTWFTILPNSSTPIDLLCDVGLFTWFRTGFLKSDTRTAFAAIDVMVPGSDTVLATKRAPLSAILSLYKESVQPIVNGLWSLCILMIGAFLSVVVTIVLPNASRRKELKQRLAPISKELRLRTPDAPDQRRESAEHERARLLLQLECKRLRDLLRISLFSLSAGTALDDVKTKTEILERKFALFHRVNSAFAGSMDPNVGHLPPTVLDRVNMHCLIGVTMLQRESLTAEEWTTLEQLVTESEQLLTSTGRQLEWLETIITMVERAVQEVLCDAGPPKTLSAPVPKPWCRLCPDLLKTIPTLHLSPFFPGQYAARDRRATFFSFVLRYAALEDVSPQVSSDPGWRRLASEFERACQGERNLLCLRSSIEQLEEGVSREMLIGRIRQGKIQISPEDVEIPSYSPARFQIIFLDAPQFNTASARQQIRVRWRFDVDGSECDGWEVWHYFVTKRQPYQISARFLDMADQPIAAANGNGDVEIHKTVTADRRPEHLTSRSRFLDVLRFVLAVVTATFALTTVRQLLPSADAFSATVGVLALGFSADVFKNLITSKKA